MWCLHGIVKALNFLSQLSLKPWCQARTEKDDFINDLINHQKSPIHTFFSYSFFLPISLPPASSKTLRRTHTQAEIGTHAYTCSFSRHCNTSSLVFSLSSPDFNLLPPWPAGSKSPKKQCHRYSRGTTFSGLPPQKDNCLSACPELRKIIA